MPTGLGKTSLIDVAVYTAAVSSCSAEGPGRRRIFFLIDRRAVVDEAYEHAQRLAVRLATPPNDGVADIAARLAGLAGTIPEADGGPEADVRPLQVARMRGGVTWDWRWIDRPDRPAVAVGTVDQLGSRYLFRGYGLGSRMHPIDAALVGTDSLIIVDEAHLSRPLIETIRRCSALDDSPLPTGKPTVLTMSATIPSGEEPASVHKITAADHADKVAGQRLRADKGLHLVGCPGGKTGGEIVSRVLADLAERLLGGGTSHTKAVGVVCNTVQRARDVFEELRQRTVPANVILLTGRVRPFDRERLREENWTDLRAARDRTAARPVVAVCTQTIEVGVNLDFDALVSESAPIDALIQRLGRLNRLGTMLEPATGVVVHDPTPQYVYGEPRDRTWDWLAGLVAPVAATARKTPELGDRLDASPLALAEIQQTAPQSQLAARPKPAPALLPRHLDTWVQTAPIPATDPEISLFLHGFTDPDRDVNLIWRSDLPSKEGTEKEWLDAVDRLPPVAEEKLAVPIRAAMVWLRGATQASEVADVQRLVLSDEAAVQEVEAKALSSPVLIWRGPGDGQLVAHTSDLAKLRPGDTLVIGAERGGCDRWGWFPQSTDSVTDLADLAGGSQTLRLDPVTLAPLVPMGLMYESEEADPPIAEWLSALNEASDEGLLRPAAEDLVGKVHGFLTPAGRALIFDVSKDDEATCHDLRSVTEYAVDGQRRYLLTFGDSRAPAGMSAGRANRLRYSADGDDYSVDPASSSRGGRVTLEAHSTAVRNRAEGIAQALGIPSEIADAVVIAAEWHDLGKCDPRFQTMLHAGDDLAAAAAIATGVPLAKSGIDSADRRGLRRAVRLSRLPRGFRHEVGSAAAAQDMATRHPGLDADLLVHLVAAHHGYARPLFPPTSDDGQRYRVDWRGAMADVDPSLSVDWSHVDRFHRLNQKYGRWGLALLETIVRLADIGCSEEGT